MQANSTVLVCHQHFGNICENLSIALFGSRSSLAFFLTRVSQIVTSQDHVLCRSCDRRSVLRCQDIVYGKHQESCFCLCFYAQRYVYRHLVSVEVGVERSTCQWVKLDSLTFNQYRFECLDTQSVESRGTVQHYRMFLDNAFENVPNFRSYLFYHSLGALDIVSIAVFNEFLHDERLEQLEGHLLRKTALPET